MDTAEYTALLARARPFLREAATGDKPEYGQIAVAGDAWIRGRAELYLRGLPELPLDEDQLVDALVLALEELDHELGLRAWNPDLHPRGPGGRFRSTVDVLKDRIQQHRDGGGPGDPFDGYTREQLRRAAKARGIELQRGEDRDSIAAKLLADFGAAGGRPERPSAGLRPGTDRTAWLEANASRVRSAIREDDSRDDGLGEILREQGFDGRPNVVGVAELDRSVRNGWTEVWRGVDPGMSSLDTSLTGRKINEEFRAGPLFPGLGLYGNGTYTSVNRQVGEIYAGASGDFTTGKMEPDGLQTMEPGGLVRMAINPAARIITYDDLLDEQRRFLASRSGAVADVAADPGRFAAMLGYDAVRIVGQIDGSDIANPATGRDDHDQYLILNRTAVKVQREEP